MLIVLYVLILLKLSLNVTYPKYSLIILHDSYKPCFYNVLNLLLIDNKFI